MDFSLTDEQRDIKNAAREFAENEFPPIAEEFDEKEIFPREVWKKACELGFVGAFIAPAYGGSGLGLLDYTLIAEEFWRVDPGIGQALFSTAFGAEIIQLHGTPGQKERYLPRVVKGKAIMGLATTEPDAGSDITSAKTTAVRKGDVYRINGGKTMIGNGSIGDFLLVLCLTNPERPKVHERFSFFIVETDRPGYDGTHMHGKMGLKAYDSADVGLNNVEVPLGNLLGTEEGRGFYQAMDFFNMSRSWVGGFAVGAAQGAMEKAIRHVKERVQFGRTLATFQALRFKVAEMATYVEMIRNMVYRAAWAMDQGIKDHKLVAMAKWVAAELAVKVVDEALQLHGGYGYFSDYGVEKYYRAIKAVEIYEGTKEIEKHIIANEILGRVRE
ncbi:MAG: acyl-CoA dehydrogenase [Deltaproteobacteria bacterium]|nr:MAG: acyl-CoA dehydrogenase [Deltaproteobacteria bacterium]